MEQQLKILYSDESGKLKIRGIGKCNIYVYNDGSINRNPYFWVISVDKTIIMDFRLNQECIYNNMHFTKIYKGKKLTKHNQVKIYKYIKNNKDDNGKSKWNNMIESYCNYFNIKQTDFIENESKSQIVESHRDYLDLGKRLGQCELIFNDQFEGHLVIQIHSMKSHFIGYVSMITGKYFGGDKLTKEEFEIINNYMRTRPNFHNEWHGYTLNDNTSNWYFIFKDFIINSNYLEEDIIEKCRKYTDTDNQIPIFNTEEYYNELELKDYINNLLKGE